MSGTFYSEQAANRDIGRTMHDATQAPLTFALLDAQIEALPEGPVSTLRSPRWMRPWTFVGLVGLALGLLPSLLILWLAVCIQPRAIAQNGWTPS